MAIKKRNDDEFIDDLIAPISDIYQEANSKVLSIMVNRIKQIGTLSPTDAGRLSIMLKNRDLAEIEKVLSDATKLSISQIDSIVEESASYNDDLSEELFKARNISANSFRSNSSLLAIVEQAKKSMVDDVVRLSNTTAFVLNGKVTDIGKTYNYAVNRAVFETQQGLFDFNTSLRSVVRELVNSGIRTVDFESGYSRRLDSQVRMNLSDGVRILNANYRETQGNEFGADGIELSAHAIASPDHSPYQGKQYSKKEFDRLQSTLERPFFAMNCKHSSYPIILGISKPAYSDKELAEIRQNSDELVKYTLPSGKIVSRPRYEATQDQRLQELKLRKLKDMKNQLETLGDDVGVKEYSKRIKEETDKYKKMSSQMGISPKMERAMVPKQEVQAKTKPVQQVKNVEIPKKVEFVNSPLPKEIIPKQVIEKPLTPKQTQVIAKSIPTKLKPSDVDKLPMKKLQSELRKNAIEFYKTPEMAKLIGNRKPEEVVDSLLIGASKTSMQKDLKSILKKIGK